jgi:hypothetical protein
LTVTIIFRLEQLFSELWAHWSVRTVLRLEKRLTLRLGGVGLRIGRQGRIEVVEVLVDGVADGIAPIIGAKGVDVFVLGEMDGLDESLGEIGEGSGGARFYIALENGGDEAAEGGAEIVDGEVVAGEAIGEVAGEFIGSAGLGFLASVVEAEVGNAGSFPSDSTSSISLTCICVDASPPQAREQNFVHTTHFLAGRTVNSRMVSHSETVYNCRRSFSRPTSGFVEDAFVVAFVGGGTSQADGKVKQQLEIRN